VTPAFVSEEMDFDGVARWFTGRFRCSAGGESAGDLPLEEALARARAGAAVVVVRLGDDRMFSAGREPASGLPVWPPDELPPLVRRRPPDERWRDRTEADPPIAWHVVVAIGPPGERVPEREAVRTVVARVAERGGADSWDTDGLDRLLADIDQARRDAGGGEDFGWYSSGSTEGRAVFTAVASTPAAAEGDVAARIEAPAGWRVRCEAVPANAHSTRRSSSD
jgi:hypothetical protein